MTSPSERLRAIENEHVRLGDEIAALRNELGGGSASPAKPAAHDNAPREMSITTFHTGGHFEMPTPDELRKLYAIATRALPAFAKMAADAVTRFESDDAPYERFKAAFRALGYIGRATKIDERWYPSFWVDQVNEKLRALGSAGDADCPALVLAAACHGDIPFRAHPPIQIEFGLVAHGGGLEPANAWRNVLDLHRVPASAPVRDPQPRPHYPAPQTRIRYSD